jgi:hypothetical protein
LARAAVDAFVRLRGVLVVAAGAAAIFAAMHVVLGYALSKDATAVHPRQRPLGWALYDRIWGRVAAIDHMYHNGQLPRDTRLGVFLGVSTTATGIQRKYLDERATAADRWIVLTGAGLSFENLESVMLPVFFCSLKPSTVVFGVHPQMLVGERYLGDEASAEFQQVVGRRRRALESRFAGFRAVRGLRKHWAVENRAIVGEFLRSLIYMMRLTVFYQAGVSAEGFSAPAPEPWDDDPLWLWYMDDAERQFAHDQVGFWSRRGHFESENYDPQAPQAQSLVRMIHAYRSLGADVYIVILPLRSTLRKIIPKNAKPCLLKVLHDAFPEAPPKVIDLDSAIPDALFTDEAHLSKSGGDRLSRMVADQLKAPEEKKKPAGK